MPSTLTAYRRALAAELGGYALVQATGTGSANTIALPFVALSTELPTSALAYTWVYVPSLGAANQARITGTGLNGTTSVITLEKPLISAVTTSTLVELHAKLPATSDAERPPGALSLNECVNLSLRHQLVEDDGLAIPLVSGQRDYALPALSASLDRAQRLVDVRQLDATGGSYVSTWRAWEFRESGRGAVLHFTQPPRFSGGPYSVRLVTLRPADQMVLVGGVVAAQTGLVLETDQAVPDLNAVTEVALAFAYKTLRDTAAASSRATYAALYEAQAARARTVRHYDHSSDAFPDVPTGTASADAAPPPAGAVLAGTGGGQRG